MNLQFWRICGYAKGERNEAWLDRCEKRQNNLFGKFEEAGYIGFCVTCISPHEGRKIRHWCKNNGKKDDFYWTNVNQFEDYDKLIGGYWENSRCVWMKPHLTEEFKTLIESFPIRIHEIPFIGKPNQTIMRVIRGLNHKFVYAMKDDPDRTYNGLLSIQNFPKINQLKVLAAIS